MARCSRKDVFVDGDYLTLGRWRLLILDYTLDAIVFPRSDMKVQSSSTPKQFFSVCNSSIVSC